LRILRRGRQGAAQRHRHHRGTVYTQCSTALVRSHLWDASRHVDESSLPGSGTIMKSLQQGFDGDSYDWNYPQRLRETIY
jgi:hypothetical protein